MRETMTYTEFCRQWISEEKYIVCHTSGSTGRPKEILLPKSEMSKSAWRTIGFFGLNGNSRLHSCISPDFIGGKMMAVRAFMLIDGFNGRIPGNLTYEKPSNRPLENYEGSKIDLLAVVPSQMEWIVSKAEEERNGMASHSLPEIGAILVGGAPVASSLRKKIEESGLNAWETYGMTETASHIAVRKIEMNPSPFKPLPGIRISPENDCLAIEIEGWQRIVTNDIARIDGCGNFEILSRADNAIITGGKKVFPEEVEKEISAQFDFPVAISWEEDEKWGQKIVLLAETDSEKIEECEIIDRCRLVVEGYKVPKRVIFGKIPRTANGKVARKVCSNKKML